MKGLANRLLFIAVGLFMAAPLVVIAGVSLNEKRTLTFYDAKTGAERIEARDATAGAASGIAADLTTTTTDQQRVEVRITADTRQLAIDLETLRRENPSVDYWMRGDIPGELRELARARREARDRLGAAAPGSGAADPGTAAAGDAEPR